MPDSPEDHFSEHSKTGVPLAAHFRQNLLIDRYDPQLLILPKRKLECMRSINSEDVVTWNVFRTLRQLDPQAWIPSLFVATFPGLKAYYPKLYEVDVRLWPKFSSPDSYFAARALREGQTEVDVVIETEDLVWSIEAKLHSDVSMKTTNDAERNQIIRNIDVGSWYAGPRDFYFSLVVSNATDSPLGSSLVQEYSAAPEKMTKLLSHRTDGAKNLRGLGILTWQQIGDVVANLCAGDALANDERSYCNRLLFWMRHRGIIRTEES